ncbi:VOC family protein [Streptomyces sp. NPDC051041]|uniref:VOC family protein n=1 Tax=Streptomyces sp. NPDC051041 TaxID=3365640 RepID=UPI0037BC99F3
MAVRLNPYLSFAGDARQALEFYQEIFGGTLRFSTYAEFGPPDAPGADRIMHGMLETPDGLVLMGADVPPGTDHIPGNNFAVSLSGDDDAGLRGCWQRLSADGEVVVPLEKQVWGDVLGMCTDRFGVPWMVAIGRPRS